MQNLNEYIIEKLKIDKDTKVLKDAIIPTNREEFIDFIDKYFREWWDSDSPGSINSEKYYKASYDYIMKYLKDERKFGEIGIPGIFTNVLPVKFIKYMNDKYNLGYPIKS